jgi:proteic killer suppression protein
LPVWSWAVSRSSSSEPSHWSSMCVSSKRSQGIGCLQMLEALSGNRRGQHSIRVNRQYRICFKWAKDSASDVEIVDYH